MPANSLTDWYHFQARDNKYAAIKNFLEMFPQLKDNPLFLFGQSYGGINVAVLAAKIVDEPELNFQVSFEILKNTSILHAAFCW